MTTKIHAVITTVLFAAVAPIAAQNAPSVESRLRDQLKSMTGQLRTLETEKATLVADKAASEEKAKSLETKVQTISKERADEASLAKADGEKLRGEIASKDVEIAQKKAELVKATEFGTKASEMARKTESARSKLDSENTLLKRIVADQRTKNGKMFEIGNEILTRYQKFGFGTAITAREPFIGVTRAKLETLIEEYGGKLAEQRLKAVGNTPAAKPAEDSVKNSKSSPSDTKRPRD